MIDAVLTNFPSSNPTAGNELQVRTWLGDVQSIPAYQVRSALLPFISSAHPPFCSLAPFASSVPALFSSPPADALLMSAVWMH
jgi:hypothetical protein